MARPTSLKTTPNDRFFEKLVHGSFILLSEFLPDISKAEKKPPKKYFSYFVLMSGLELETWLYV